MFIFRFIYHSIKISLKSYMEFERVLKKFNPRKKEMRQNEQVANLKSYVNELCARITAVRNSCRDAHDELQDRVIELEPVICIIVYECPHCGETISVERKKATLSEYPKCPNCGYEYPNIAKRCPVKK